ncbi:hypothetical protein LJC14_07845, partial [Treponema sp. OttesenSCG-928-L16]|nr:hypothetical protein [Treponema sp. OttesenSCG-928-L16]
LEDVLAKSLPERQDELTEASADGCGRVKQTIRTGEGWKRETGRIQTEVYAAILSKYINEAGQWMSGKGVL